MSGAPLYLAIDQGTHASRAVVLDARGAVVATGSKDLGLVRPQPDRADTLVASRSRASCSSDLCAGKHVTDPRSRHRVQPSSGGVTQPSESS